MYLNEATLLHNLKIRYQKDEIYVSIQHLLSYIITFAIHIFYLLLLISLILPVILCCFFV